MKLSELFYQSKTGTLSTTSTSSSSSNGGDSFDAIMKTTETQKTTDNTKNDYSSNNKSSSTQKDKDYSKDNSSSYQDKKTTTKESASTNSNKTETTQSKPADKASTNTTQKTTENKAAETIKIQEEAGLEQMAEVMGITVEVLNTLMQDLGLSLTDLTDKSNVDLLLKAVYELESDVQLLEVDNITDVLGTIKDVAEEATTVRERFVDVEETTVSNSETMKQTEEGQEIIAAALDKSADKLSSQRNNAHVDTPVVSENPGIVMATGLAENKVINAISASNELDFDIMDETIMTGANGNTTTSSSAQNALFKTALSNASAMKDLDPAEIMKQVTDQVKIEIRANITEMKMTLRPEQLGDISLKVVTENGIVSAELKAESEKVKEILESNAAQLKELLNEQGIEVSEISVSVNTGQSDQLEQQFYEGQQKNNRRINQIINGIEDDIAMEELETEQIITEAEVANSNVEYKV